MLAKRCQKTNFSFIKNLIAKSILFLFLWTDLIQGDTGETISHRSLYASVPTRMFTESSVTTISALHEEVPPFTIGSSISKGSIFGSGCPTEESLQIILTPDGKTVSVLYSEYMVEARKGNSIDRKTCNIAIPVDVNDGKSIGIFRVDYRGNAYTPINFNNSYGLFMAEYFFAGKKGYKIKERFDQGYNDDFMLSMNITESDIAWCECGASTIFRINSSIFAFYNEDKEQSLAGGSIEVSIDSADATVKKGFEYFFAVKDC